MKSPFTDRKIVDIKKALNRHLAVGIEEHVFPGASVSVTLFPNGEPVCIHTAYGKESYSSDAYHIGRGSIIETASIAKSLFSLIMLMILEEKGCCYSLETKIGSIFGSRCSTSLGQLTIGGLLAHKGSYNLPDNFKLLRGLDLIKGVLHSELEGAETVHRYNNFHALVLGELLKIICGKNLSQILQERLLRPLQIEGAFWNELDDFRRVQLVRTSGIARDMPMVHDGLAAMVAADEHANDVLHCAVAGVCFSAVELNKLLISVAMGGRKLGGAQMIPESVIERLLVDQIRDCQHIHTDGTQTVKPRFGLTSHLLTRDYLGEAPDETELVWPILGATGCSGMVYMHPDPSKRFTVALLSNAVCPLPEQTKRKGNIKNIRRQIVRIMRSLALSM